MKEIFNRLPDIRSIPGKLTRTKNGLLSIIVGAASIMVAAVVMSAPEPDKKEVEEAAWSVTTVAAEPRTVSPELRLYGRIETPRKSSLTAMVVAQVKDVEALEGSQVERGQVLVQLDPTDASLEVERRRADLTEAKANLATLELKAEENRSVLSHEEALYAIAASKVDRHQKLRDERSISEETLSAVKSEANRQAISLSRQQTLVNDATNQLTRARAQVERAEAVLREASVRLERTQVRAPFDGQVTAVNVSRGELIQPGAVVVEMYDTSSMEVRAQIPAEHLATIREALRHGDLRASIVSSETQAAATLSRLSGEVGKGQTSVDGLFTVGDTESLELGRAVSVTLELPPIAETIAVPVQSLYGHDRIYLVVNERLKGITIERMGETKDEQGNLSILIRSIEIEPGASIVTSQISNAITGLKVIEAKKPGSDDGMSPVVDDLEMEVAAVK